MNSKEIIPLVALMGAAVAFTVFLRTDKSPNAQLRRARDRVRKAFDVSPGCTLIKFKRPAEDARVFWTANEDYLLPMIALYGVTYPSTAESVTDHILGDLFPECDFTQSGRADLAILRQALRLKVSTLMEG